MLCPGCPRHLVDALERTINAYPWEWLLKPQTGEEFTSLDACNYRLRAFALVEGFDIVSNGGGTKGCPILSIHVLLPWCHFPKQPQA